VEHKIGLYWYNALIYVKEDDTYRKLSDEEIDDLRRHTKLAETIN
jgi:hypothetical protein